MRRRVGVYGGMFDPVHSGHLEVARYAREALALEKVYLVPCKQPNHRSVAQASGSQRLRMLELACADDPSLVASDIELQRDGVSYSVDTLAQLRAQEPGTDFVFILGRDALLSLPKWERWQELLRDNLLAVVSRESALEDDAPADAQEQTRSMPVTRWAPPDDLAEALSWKTRCLENAEDLFAARRDRLISLEALANPLSSTRVREALARAQSIGLPPRVAAYLAAEGLYK